MARAVGWLASCFVIWTALAGEAIAQELPSGGGPIPELRRGRDGQIEVVRPSAPAHQGGSRERPARAAATAKAGPPVTSGSGVTLPAPPPQPVLTVTPTMPRIPDTTPLGGIVASYSVKMSDGSPFTGSVRFAAPNYDAKRKFAIAGDKIIVNPNGPGLGRDGGTGTYRITLETVP